MNKFKPEIILVELEKFLDGDFKEWCKVHSLEPFDVEDENSLKEIVGHFPDEAHKSYLHFKELADKLEDYVAEYTKEHGENHVSISLLMNKITRIKERYEGQITNGWINGVIKEINAEAKKYYIGDDDYVDERTGRVRTIKRFKKRIPYIYEWNLDMYRLYFKLATRELWFLLKSYVKDYKEGRLLSMSDRINLNGKEYTKELINEMGSIADLRKKLTLPLTLKIYDEQTRARLRTCYKILSQKNTFIIGTEKEEAVFVNIFSKEPVANKVIWNRSNIELVYFINSIEELLESSTYKWDRCVSCFERYDGNALGIQSFKDANTKNLTRILKMAISEKDKIEQLKSAVDKFKG